MPTFEHRATRRGTERVGTLGARTQRRHTSSRASSPTRAALDERYTSSAPENTSRLLARGVDDIVGSSLQHTADAPANSVQCRPTTRRAWGTRQHKTSDRPRSVPRNRQRATSPADGGMSTAPFVPGRTRWVTDHRRESGLPSISKSVETSSGADIAEGQTRIAATDAIHGPKCRRRSHHRPAVAHLSHSRRDTAVDGTTTGPRATTRHDATRLMS